MSKQSLHQTAHESVLSYSIVVQFTAFSLQSDGGYAILSAAVTESTSAGFTGYSHISAKLKPE